MIFVLPALPACSLLASIIAVAAAELQRTAQS
jgi:hypothetical protein